MNGCVYALGVTGFVSWPDDIKGDLNQALASLGNCCLGLLCQLVVVTFVC